MKTELLTNTIEKMQPIQDTINSTAKHTGPWLTTLGATIGTALTDMTSIFQSLAALAAVGYSLLLIYLKIRDEIIKSKKQK